MPDALSPQRYRTCRWCNARLRTEHDALLGPWKDDQGFTSCMQAPRDSVVVMPGIAITPLPMHWPYDLAPDLSDHSAVDRWLDE